MGRRVERVAAQIARDVGGILQRRVKDPDLGFITITRAEVTADLRHAKVYYAVYGDAPALDRTAAALERATGFVRRELGRVLDMRYTPEVSFVFDQGYVEAIGIMDAIRRLDPSSGNKSEG